MGSLTKLKCLLEDTLSRYITAYNVAELYSSAESKLHAAKQHTIAACVFVPIHS